MPRCLIENACECVTLCLFEGLISLSFKYMFVHVENACESVTLCQSEGLISLSFRCDDVYGGDSASIWKACANQIL